VDIKEFKDEHRFLSNFYPAQVVFEGNIYKTVEHAYQAAKTIDSVQRKDIGLAKTPGVAKFLGRCVTMREDWLEIKVDVMRKLLAQKFKQPRLRRLLINTFPYHIQEGNYWNDTFWGVCLKTHQGRNMLGKLLVEIRDNILD